MNELVTVNFDNQRVLTTKQLAEIYEVDTNIISKNFSNHRDKFTEGKLKEFKNYMNAIFR